MIEEINFDKTFSKLEKTEHYIYLKHTNFCKSKTKYLWKFVEKKIIMHYMNI